MLPFVVSYLAAVTTVSSGYTVGWVRYVCLKNIVLETLSNLVDFAEGGTSVVAH